MWIYTYIFVEVQRTNIKALQFFGIIKFVSPFVNIRRNKSNMVHYKISA